MHPSAHIRAKYINNTKDHKMELAVLIRESMKVVRRGATEVRVFSSRILILKMANFMLQNDTSMWYKKEPRSTCLVSLFLL